MAASATISQRTQVSQEYVALFGRAPDSEGLGYWVQQMVNGKTINQIANDMFNVSAARVYYPAFATNQEIVNSFYKNVLGRDADAEGSAYWTAKLSAPNATPGQVINDMIIAVTSYTGTDAAALTSKALYNNKVVVGEYYGATMQGGSANATAAISTVTATTDVSTSTAIESAITAGGGVNGFTLTNGTDLATSGTFTAPMVYTPDGSDRILSLQDEDVLTGTAGRTDNTLNATIGQKNADEGTSGSVTATLKNIQIVNLDWTGDTQTVDVRYADSISTINVNKITLDANTVTVSNINTVAANLKVANAANASTTVTFDYTRGVLQGTADVANVSLDSVLAQSVKQNALSSGNGVEGFETVNLTATRSVELDSFSVNEMEVLNITGSGSLDLVDLAATKNQYSKITGGNGIANPDSVGLRTIDASKYSGALNIDITNATGKHTDPADSGATFYSTVTGGTGNDTFWTDTVDAESTAKFDKINGGAGNNTLKLYKGDIVNDASIVNIQTLEVRSQVAADQTIDFDAFDDALLTKVYMRDEANNGGDFILKDVGATLAASGNIVLAHSSDDGVVAPTVKVDLKADTATDTVAVTVVNALNTGTTFDYTLNIDVPVPAGKVDGDQGVENVTISDNDTESNSVTLTESDEHTGTVTLAGGVAAQTYTVTSKLEAVTVDAATQLSDLRLTVGNKSVTGAAINQTIKLGAGNDILTFSDINSFNGSDTITDVGGTDTVRAAFSKDVTGAVNLTGIEKLHIVATANVALDMSKAATVSELAILSNTAVDDTTTPDLSPLTEEPFAITGVEAGKTITLSNTALSTLNYFADNDTNDVVPLTTESGDHIFNAVTLANNSATALTVNINASIDPGAGSDSYTLGKITAHGITSMGVVVSNERDVTVPADSKMDTITTINNIYAKDMTSLTVTTTGFANLGLVSGNATNNSLITLDASKVSRDFAVQVNSLGDAAVVTAGGGDAWIDARNSAGKSATFTAANGANTIYTAAGNDTVTTGAGVDVISVDRGQNIVKSGAGNDFVVGSNQDNTVDVGTGFNLVNFNRVFDAAGTTLGATGLVHTAATNTVSVAGGTVSAFVYDSAGAIAREVNLGTAATTDSVTVSYLGSALQSATRNGTNALTTEAAFAGTAGDDFFVFSADTNIAGEAGGDGSDMLVGGSGADVLGGDAGNDVISGNAGNDTLNGGTGDDLILGGTGNDTISGGDGNDSIYAGDGTDGVTGGTGADIIVLASNSSALQWTPGTAAGDANTVAAPTFAFAIDASVDTVVIAVGDSTASGYDQVTGFNVLADILDLGAALTIATTGSVTSTDAGAVLTHAVTAGGLITFDDAAVYAAPVVVSSSTTVAGRVSLADALAYLGANVINDESVFFQYDANGDGDVTDAGVDATFVFQGGVADTVVQLVGTVGVTTIAGAAGANTVAII